MKFHLPKKDSFRKAFKKRKAILIVASAIMILFFIEDALFTINALSHGPAIGMKLNGQRVGGWSPTILKGEISRQASQPLLLQYQEHIYSITSGDVNAKVNTDEVMRQLLRPGHEGGIFSRIIEQNQALLGYRNVSLTGSMSAQALSRSVAMIQQQVAEDPTVTVSDIAHPATAQVIEKNGVTIDTAKTAAIISHAILNPTKKPIAIPVVAIVPVYTDKERELKKITLEAATLTKAPLSIRSGVDVLTLSPKQLQDMLVIESKPDETDPTKSRYVLRFNTILLNQTLGDFAAIVEGHTQAEFADHDARIAIYSQFFSGRRTLIDIPTGNNVALRKELVAAGLKTAPIVATLTASPESSSSSAPSFFAATAHAQFSPFGQHQKTVYLTFDDGPNAIYHPLILDILKKYNVKATFFLVGDNIKKYETIAKRTVAEGHTIGNHTMTHAFLPKLSNADINKEITMATMTMQSTLGISGKLFRPPYGGVNTDVKNDSKNLNLELTLWDVDPRDWSEPTTDELVKRVISHAYNGADILMHSNHQSTVNALPIIIEKLLAQGYTFKTLQ